jgi:CheY-like chemotaxis protein
VQTLLLADDSVTVQRVIELTFADEDIKVVSVSDGDEAIARIDSAPPDIVLVDVGMPGRNGYEVSQHVKASPRLAHIPVVLLTGAFEPVDQDQAKRSGCDGVLAKPFEPQFVISRVKELLGKAHPAEAPIAQTPLDVPKALLAGPPLTVTPREIRTTPVPVAPVVRPAAPQHAIPQHADLAQNVDDYFERLDAAFADRSAAPPALPALTPESDLDLDLDLYPDPQPEPAAEPEPKPKVPPLLQPQPEPRLKSVPEPLPQPVPQAVPPPVTVAGPAVAAPRPKGAVAIQSLADAFATLLEAEQHHASPDSAPAWPHSGTQSGSQPAPEEPVDVDDLADRVARRVLEQLSDRVVRDTVFDIVSPIAERLVREEIDRIKASLK